MEAAEMTKEDEMMAELYIKDEPGRGEFVHCMAEYYQGHPCIIMFVLLGLSIRWKQSIVLMENSAPYGHMEIGSRGIHYVSNRVDIEEVFSLDIVWCNMRSILYSPLPLEVKDLLSSSQSFTVMTLDDSAWKVHLWNI